MLGRVVGDLAVEDARPPADVLQYRHDARALGVSEYSTRGGISSKDLRWMMPSAMSSFSADESTVSDTSTISSRSWL